MQKKIKIESLGEPDNDREYWLSKTPQERLEAIEALRSVYIELNYGKTE